MRLRQRREIEGALDTLDLLTLTNPGGFTGEVVRTMLL